MSEPKKIAVIGAGHVGGTLGAGWAKTGHSVVFGVRKPDSAETTQALERAGHSTRAASPAEAAKSCEIVALAVPWPAAREAVASLGNLSGKVLLDCTNPSSQSPEMDHEKGKSGGEQVASWAQGAHVVKIFNTTGFGNMANPIYPGAALTMFYAGDDADSKKVAHQLAADLGFDPQDIGPLRGAFVLEELASLWGLLAMGQGLGMGIGFRLLRR
jgi:predicted dinucleotide-binding enzyme